MTPKTRPGTDRIVTGRVPMIPGAWDLRRPATYIPASQAGAVSTLAQTVALDLDGAVPPHLSTRSSVPAAARVTAATAVMMIVTWAMLWMASLAGPAAH